MHAVLVGAGILLSRILGLVRESLKARFLGATGDIAADAFHAAFRIPNVLQNLFGEGSLSASFIPVYSNALARGNREEADRLAGAIGALLALVAAVLVLLGVIFAPALVAVIAPGFEEGPKRDLTVSLTRILFPGAALFVFSAWCLGILNSHRRFFLSYAAPVAWNLTMIAALLVYRRSAPATLATNIAWASVAGAALTFIVQLPVVFRVAPALRLSLGRGNEAVRRVMRNFVPAFFGRGVVQVNAYIDQLIASFLPTGAISLLFYSQTITMLPISLFGMSVSAAELPEMSSATGDDEQSHAHVRTRLNIGLRQIAFLVVPSAVAFFMLGDVIAAALFQWGRFTAEDTRFTWGILAAASLGLLASTLGRLYSSGFYALNDTKTPLRIALVRVTLAMMLGTLFALYLPGLFGVAPQWGAAALALSSSIVGWVEFTLLRRRLNARIGRTGAAPSFVLTLLTAALASGAAGVGVKLAVAGLHRLALAALVLGTFGALYLVVTSALRVPESLALLDRLRRTRA
ncbi:MAG: murein biosynthesis integral membrane protein MurJ [Gemmatimonadaceae bacterium]